jgi:hypothetical protein
MEPRDLLKDWNQRWSTPGTANTLAILVFVCVLAFFVGYMRIKGVLNSPPAAGGDAVDYDQIAWNLQQGYGFSRDRVVPAVDRPPLYPALLAATFRSSQRYDLIRQIQAVVLALVATGVAKMTSQRVGAIPVLLVPLLLVIDPRVRTMGAEILTEALACGLTTGLWVLLSRWERQPRWGLVIACGVILGLSVLCRTMAIVWLPVIAGTMLWRGIPCAHAARQEPRPPAPVNGMGNEGLGVRCRRVAVLLLTAIAVILPWAYRNVTVLGEFRPLGTQGEEQLVAAWSDEAFARCGMWYNADEQGFFRNVTPDSGQLPAIRRANQSRAAAVSWIGQHPLKALLLPPMRLFQEFRPHGPGDLFILAFAALGLVLVWRTPEGRAARAIILAQGVAIALTWSVAGRFLYPLLGILHFLAIVGLWGACVTLVRERETARAELLFPLRDPT